MRKLNTLFFGHIKKTPSERLNEIEGKIHSNYLDTVKQREKEIFTWGSQPIFYRIYKSNAVHTAIDII